MVVRLKQKNINVLQKSANRYIKILFKLLSLIDSAFIEKFLLESFKFFYWLSQNLTKYLNLKAIKHSPLEFQQIESFLPSIIVFKP